MHALVVEDDAAIVAALTSLLKSQNIDVTSTATQSGACQLLAERSFDIALLDVTLAEGSGFVVCAAARNVAPAMPIIFLTASDDEYSTVAGLDMGAADYIAKPFRPRELLSRIQAALRRSAPEQNVLEAGDVRLNITSGTVTKAGAEVVLSALEVDCNYDVNVLTGSDGIIRGAIGGHPDTAAGASVAIVVAPLIRGRIPTVVEKVGTVVTPGKTVDVIVTDQGIAVNPHRINLTRNLREAGIPLCSIEELKEKAERIVGKPKPIPYTDRVVGVVAYRDNTVIDVIRQVKP